VALPNSLVRLSPGHCEEFQDQGPYGSAALGDLHASLARLSHRVDDLAKDVDLQLLVCGVSNSHWHGIFVAGQPRNDHFWRPALPADTVDDPHLLRTASDSPNEPVSPCPRFVVVSEMHQGQERECSVPQPAVAVIPVSDAAETLRQRRRGSSDDPARWGVGQSLQCNKRSFDRFRPRPNVRTPIAPLAPERFRALQCIERVNRQRPTLK